MGLTRSLILDALMENPDGLTATELAMATGGSRAVVAKQAHDYLKTGDVKQEGTRELPKELWPWVGERARREKIFKIKL